MALFENADGDGFGFGGGKERRQGRRAERRDDRDWLRPQKKRKDVLKADLAQMEAGTLGPSDQERADMTARGAAPALQGIANAQRESSQNALTAGPLSAVTGRAAEQQLDLGAQGGEATAMVGGAVEAAAQDDAMLRREQILAALEREGSRRTERRRYIASMLMPHMDAVGVGAEAGLAASGEGQQGGDVMKVAGSAAMLAMCWVADELYGVTDPRAALARAWCMQNTDHWFVKLYAKHGQTWAALLRKHTWAKPLVQPIWDSMWQREMYRVA